MRDPYDKPCDAVDGLVELDDGVWEARFTAFGVRLHAWFIRVEAARTEDEGDTPGFPYQCIDVDVESPAGLAAMALYEAAVDAHSRDDRSTDVWIDTVAHPHGLAGRWTVIAFPATGGPHP